MSGSFDKYKNKILTISQLCKLMVQLIAASVVIGDRTYRIKCAPEDEEVVRKTVKTINDKIVEFKTQFAGKDMQDYISMVLLWFATDQITRMKAGLKEENFAGDLSVIEQLLDNQLKDI
jgi:cell division protein ZapA (FtsZ GTPase activity inhibitor)